MTTLTTDALAPFLKFIGQESTKCQPQLTQLIRSNTAYSKLLVETWMRRIISVHLHGVSSVGHPRITLAPFIGEHWSSRIELLIKAILGDDVNLELLHDEQDGTKPPHNTVRIWLNTDGTIANIERGL
ncbi:MAG: hypothetical protein WAX89_07755 [Alphaproteobacteria bacterium]